MATAVNEITTKVCTGDSNSKTETKTHPPHDELTCAWLGVFVGIR